MKRLINKNDAPIDIVFPWVDGSDSEWLECKRKYDTNCSGDNSEKRFRDWDILRYVFRSIEKNTPWVRKVHFITWGHLPEWLDASYEKLNIVNHKDYIPSEYLPTFNSHTIELNIHRIDDLADQFIYMNDDMFFTKPAKEEDFFADGLPRSSASLGVMSAFDDVFIGILNSDKTVINRNFNSKDILMNPKLLAKFFSFKNGISANLKTLCLLPWCTGVYPGFEYFHGPNAYLKRTFIDVWNKESKKLDETCSHKFRQFNDVNQYLMLWWQWCKGTFVPINNSKKLKLIRTDRDVNYIKNAMDNNKASFLCVNDTNIDDFEAKQAVIIDCFERMFPEKSKFEK